MPKHIIEEDLLLTLDDYVKKIENTPNRIVTTDASGVVTVKDDLDVSKLDHLKNVTSDIQLQINEKSNSNHTHTEYLTLEDLEDINFSGIAENVVYNPENSTLKSTNIKDAMDEVDNKIEEHTHIEFENFVSSSEKNVAYGIATLDEHCKIPLSQIPDTIKPTNIIGTQEERLGLSTIETGIIFRETDTGDSYIYDGSTWIILADADWANIKLQWTNIEGIPTEFNPISHTHEEYAIVDHTHYANKVYFEDGDTLQEKLDGGSLGGGSSSGGECNVVISDTVPSKMPIGGIWIDISNI